MPAQNKKPMVKPLPQEVEFQLTALLRSALTEGAQAGLAPSDEGVTVAADRPVEIWFDAIPEIEACLAACRQESGTIAFYMDADRAIDVRLILTDKAPGMPTAVVIEPGQVWRLPLPVAATNARMGLRIDGHGAIFRLGILFSLAERHASLARTAPRVPLLPIHQVQAREKVKPAPAQQQVPQKPAAPVAVKPAPQPVVAAKPGKPLESFEFRLSDFAPAVIKVPGAVADTDADILSMAIEQHAYAWISDRVGLEGVLRAEAGQVIRMTLEGVVRGAPNVEVFLGFRSPVGDQNMAARPGGYSGSIRVPTDFASIRIGLRLAGSGSIERLRVNFAVEREVTARSRIEFRRQGLLGDELAGPPRLRVALIGDPFTHENFVGVTDIVAIRPNNWRALLQIEPPDLLFVESAWVGNDGAWANRIVNNLEELTALVDWCREAGIPTVFWNKEDPVHFKRFLPTARLFDRVYTTCVECVPLYQEGGIKNVDVLPFAVNPNTYNPLGSGAARETVGVFAGSYYGQKYPERTADMERLLDFTARRGLRIFDRHYGSTGAEFAFPERFLSHIVGSATPRQLDFEYKRGRIALNVNTVKDSRSMFARRVVELAATGTPIISNHSAALVELFGDVMLSSDDPEVLSAEIARLFDDEDYWHARRLGLMRSVLMNHTIQDRLAQVMRDLDAPLPDPRRSVCLVTVPSSADGAEMQDMSDEFGEVREFGPETLGQPLAVLLAGSRAEYVAFRNPGAGFDDALLLELLRHQEYAGADVVGLARREDAFRYGSIVDLSAAIVRREALLGTDITVSDLLSAAAAEKIRGAGLKTFGVERLGAPPAQASDKDGAWPAESDRIRGWWPDAKTLALDESADGAVAAEISTDSPVYVRIGERHALSAPPKKPLIHAGKAQQGFAVWFDVPELEPGQQCELHVLFYARSERLEVRKLQPNRSSFVRAPAGWTGAALAVRIKGRGRLTFSVSVDPSCRTSRAFVRKQLGRGAQGAEQWLCISSVYPHRDNIYRNAFVHTRVRQYLAAGHPTTVVSMAGDGNTLDCYDFEGVLTFQGGNAGLADILDARRWKRALIHIVSKDMLNVLDRHAPGLPKIIWVHAIEAERWYRRWFEVDFSAPDLEKRVRQLYAQSDERTAAVRKAFRRAAGPEKDSRVIFVSEWFRNNIATVDVWPPPEDYRVIHNPIDTGMFPTRKKTAKHRLRWLSIRPYAGRKYANDLTVSAILLLRDEPWFKDVEITMIGRGPLFDEVLAPLRDLPNVRIEERFLRQSEIAEMHAQNGLFLCPTRHDSQGVSLGEAMSSGLVPLSNDVMAIPEFVPREWGVLAQPDDPEDLARRIKMLVEDPALFLRLSKECARHIQARCGIETVVSQEIDAIQAP